MTDPTWTRWLARYGGDYLTDAERAAAYELYLKVREEMKEVFEDEDET